MRFCLRASRIIQPKQQPTTTASACIILIPMTTSLKLCRIPMFLLSLLPDKKFFRKSAHITFLISTRAIASPCVTPRKILLHCNAPAAARRLFILFLFPAIVPFDIGPFPSKAAEASVFAPARCREHIRLVLSPHVFLQLFALLFRFS